MTQMQSLSRALVVEDQPIIALDVSDIVEESGFAQVAIARNLSEALAIIQAEPPSFALLDVNLGEDLVFLAAEKLEEIEVPFMFVSALPLERVPARWVDHIWAPKPLTRESLLAKLSQLGFQPIR
jgi:CheY-like chemotaxis protein